MNRAISFTSLLLVAACLTLAPPAFGDDALLAAAKERTPAFLQELGNLVNMDSGTDDAKGLAQVEAFLAKRLEALGAKVEIAAAPPAAGKVVIGRFRGSGRRNIMLMVHYDTVFGVGEAAKRPFRVEGGKAYGPGVADAKGGALVILNAVDLAHRRGWKDYGTLTVFFNPDEEKSSLGSRTAIRALAAEQDYVLSYEPPEADRVIVATNGLAYVHLAVKGVASHAGSAPEKGRNAATELAHQILQLRDLGDPAKGTTVNWTVVQAGDRVNIIPEKATATGDMRMSDVSELERVQRDGERIVQKRLISETEVSFRVENRRPPFGRNPASEKLAATADAIYRELGKRIEPVAMRYGTDAGFAWSPGGRAVVLDGLGILGDRLHSADEWADVESIPPRIYLTVRLLERIGRE
jgi:glutamate carboxypeptidase